MMLKTVLILGSIALLAACKEQPQTIGSNARVDTPAFQGGSAFTTKGWKQGDKSSWESELKTRTMMGQNDYTKVN